MKIRQYLERLGGWESDDREKYLRPLMAVLTPVSLQSLRTNQQRHFLAAEPDRSAFVESQNREIVKCLELEMSSIGSLVRAQCGLEPLTLDTDVEIPGFDLEPPSVGMLLLTAQRAREG